MALPFLPVSSDDPSTPATQPGGGDADTPSLLDRLRALFPDSTNGPDAQNGTDAGASTNANGNGPAPPQRQDDTTAPIKAKIVAAAQKYGVDPALMLSLANSESSFNPNAISPRVRLKDGRVVGGAKGLFQFTSGTAKDYGVDPYDPDSAADGAARYMRDLLQSNNGDATAALAQYKGVDAGGATMGNVQQVIADSAKYRGQLSSPTMNNGTDSSSNTQAANAPAVRSLTAPSAYTPLDLGDRSDLGNFLSDRSDLAGSSPTTSTPQQTQPQADEANTPPSPTMSGNASQDAGMSELNAPYDKSQNVPIQPNAPSTPAMGSKEWFNALPPAQINTQAPPDRGFDQGQTGAVGGAQSSGDLAQIAQVPGQVADAANAGIKAGVKGILTLGGTLDNSAIENAKQTVSDIRATDEKISQSPFLTALRGVLSTDPQSKAAAQLTVAGVDALTGGTISSLMPQTMAKLDESTSTGVPLIDDVVKGGAGIASIILAPEAAIPGSFVASGVRTATGDETPLAGLAEAGLNVATLGAYSKLGAVENVVKRVVGGAAVGGASEAIGPVIHGESPTVGAIVGGALTGGALSAGGHAEPEAEVPEVDLKTKVDNAAHDAATSPLSDTPQPTPAQQAAGNYKKGHVSIQGLDISIENPQGSVRSGTDANGKPWSVQMQDHYGYIRGSTGADGDHVDAFIGPNPESSKVFVIDQQTPGADVARMAGRTDPQDIAATGPVFDEHKVILGANTPEEAETIYKRNYSDDATPRIGAITETTMPEFKAWLKGGDDPNKPFAERQIDEPTGSNTNEQPTAATAEPAVELGNESANTSEANQPAARGAEGIPASDQSAGGAAGAGNAEASVPSGTEAPAEGPIKGRAGYLYRGFDLASDAGGKGSSDRSYQRNKPFEWGGAFEAEYPERGQKTGISFANVQDVGEHHAGAVRGEVNSLPTRIFYNPENEPEIVKTELPKLAQKFPNAEFVRVSTGDNPDADPWEVPAGEYAKYLTADNSQQPQGRQPIALHAVGTETYMRAGDEKIPVKYALVEAKDVQLSHDPITFAANPEYAGENQNNYATNEAQQAVVKRGIADTDWNTIHSQTQSSTEGPTVIDQFGQAAGGNGRGMIQKGVYEQRPEEAKSAAIQNADRFGLDPAVAARMDQPMIVRVQPQDVDMSLEARRNISAQNLSVTKSRTPVEDGVDLAKRLSPENKDTLASALANVDRLSDITSMPEKAAPFIKVLRDAGQITTANTNEFLTGEGTLTSKGRETVEGATLGMAIPDAQLVDRLPSGFRQKLAENLPQLGSVESTDGWELNGNLKRIVEYNEARQRFVDQHNGVSPATAKAMYDKQYSLLPESERPPELNDEDHTILKLLEDPKRTKFKEFIRSYAEAAKEARTGTQDFSGEPMTRERAFAEASQALNIPERTGIAGYLDKTKEEDNEYIRKSLGKLSMNLDPELAARMMRRGAGFIADGAHDFAKWSEQALAEWGDRVKDDLKELYDGAFAQFTANRGEGIRGTVQELYDAYKNPPKEAIGMKRVVGNYSRDKQLILKDLTKYAAEIKQALPDKARRVAITHYLQADGKSDVLATREAAVPAKYKQGFKDAQNLTTSEKDWASAFRIRMDQTWQDAHDAGLLDDYFEHYVRGEYEQSSFANKMIASATGAGFQPNPKELQHKVFASYYDAIMAGLTPKDPDIARQVIANEMHLKLAVEARKAVAAAMHAQESDGRPSIIIGGSDGRLGTIVPGEAPKHVSAMASKTMIDEHSPHFIRPNAIGKDSKGYRYFDHSALEKWKFLGTDNAGNPILLQSTAQVHPEAMRYVKSLLGRSTVREAVPEHVPVIGGTRPGAAVMKLGSTVKGTIMVGPFHGYNLRKEAIYHGENPLNAPEIDFDNPLIREGMSHGLKLVSNEGLDAIVDQGEGQGSGLWGKIPVVGDWHAKNVQNLFQNKIPRWMAQAYLARVAKFEQHYAGDLLSGKITRDQMLDRVADQVNSSFGEKDYAYAGRNPTLQDVMRMTMIAPKFLEARLSQLGQAVTPGQYGHEARMGLLRGGLIAAATAQAFNVVFGDEHKVDLAHPFTMHFGGYDYSPREAVIDAYRMVSDPASFFNYRINPLLRPLEQFATSTNSYGQKMPRMEAFADALKGWQPIPAQGMTRMKPGDSWLTGVTNGLLGSVGISNKTHETSGEQFIDEKYDETRSAYERPGYEVQLTGARKEYRDAVRAGKSQPELDAMAAKNGFTPEQVRAIKTQAKTTDLQYKAEQLDVRQLADGFDNKFSDAEKDELKDVFARKIANANPDYEMDDDTKAAYRQKYDLPDAPARRGRSSSSGSALVGLPIR